MLSNPDADVQAESGPGRPPAAAEPARPDASIRIELKPHCRLDARSARQFFIVTCVITFAVAAIAAVYGAWPALLFAALEMWILHIAMSLSLARGRDYERVDISEDHVRIEVCAGRTLSELSFMRHWTRVRLQAAHSTLHPHRLLIECQGRHRELGAFLTEAERSEAAARLKRLIGAVGESPVLPSRQSAAEAQTPMH